MVNKIQIKRGNKVDLPILLEGEQGFCLDTKEFFIGDGSNNIQAVMFNEFNAGTFLYATSDNEPEPKTAAQVAALLSGNISSDFDLNSNKITNLAAPTAGSDAANKTYVDNVAQGLKVLDSVTVASTENLTLSGTQTIDGISVIADDRILVKDQTTASENGVYVVATGTWTRSSDLTTGDDAGASFVFIESGSVNGATGWVCSNEPESDVVGTDDLVFSQFSSAGYTNAGTGLIKSGNTISATGTLEDLSALSVVANDQFIKGTGSGTFAYRSPGQVLADLSGNASAAFSMNSQKLTNLANPTNDQDAATMKWVSDNFGAGSFSILGLIDTPGSFTANYLAKVNDAGDALEFVSFGSTYLEDDPTDGVTTKAPTSNWAYDHETATTGVHGAGGNDLLHSGSTIDCGSFV